MMSGERAEGAEGCFLDEETFRRCCDHFLQRSQALHDGWSWEQVKGTEEGYMKKTVLGTGRVNISTAQDGHPRAGEVMDAVGDQGQVDDLGDEDTPVPAEGSSVIRFEYHVLYSCSYQTPVLYFRASTLDGRPLSLEDVWDQVHPNYRQRLLQGPWDTITQQEHPLIGQPFFFLHPCRTADFMRPLLQVAHAENRKLNYIVSWLSVVGPVVGLDVPLTYCEPLGSPALPLWHLTDHCLTLPPAGAWQTLHSKGCLNPTAFDHHLISFSFTWM
ncbi:hypothetical protein AGOR_G00015370 [Albula goreensis]|uniref:Ubiquitin-like-conjugating enzyme ATG10 n=1 Tax=Albula goreensis TaxID=1534307 RepID=A0A8T3EBS4_9TELE|nr:hypothetical protein AGOR_G00015370 [Albula goreensis]